MNREEFIEQIMMSCTKTKKDFVELVDSEKTKISISVKREELELGQIQKHLNIIERAEKKKTKARSSITLMFEGYNNRGLLQHGEIRQYLRRLFKVKPHMFYFLSKESNIQAILLSLLEVDTGTYGKLFADRLKGHAEFTFYGADLNSLIRKHVTPAIRYANKMKEPPCAQKDLIIFLLDSMDYERLNEESI
ncbi:hypothetical protein [Paenibacillus polymyxa]|uniref:hypothetical protein n=1 Tax=Paenibacillus polymyxa TaxID=1406 RepID=UPI0025B686F3|nr:hypothetical protein [Paenibacillus polymyxa]MDN4106463.1 hypothetical protein [Paenibacillus polymyxa]